MTFDIPSGVHMGVPTFVTRSTSQKYVFLATLFKNGDYRTQSGFVLDSLGITKFKYRNSANQLYLTAELEYFDSIGKLTNFINVPFVNCIIVLYHMTTKGNEVVDYPTTTISSSDDAFVHNFIVTDLQILGRDETTIKYKLKLVSANWHNCTATLDYSDYDSDPKSVYKTISDCMTQVGLAVDQTSLAAMPENPKSNYATAGNSTLCSAVQYLMGLLHYYSDDLDRSLKFITYNETDDKYYFCDLNNRNTFMKNSYSVVLSMYKGSEEALTNGTAVELGSGWSRQTDRRGQWASEFPVTMYSHDLSANSLVPKMIPSETIASYYNGFDTPTVDSDKYYENRQITYQPIGTVVSSDIFCTDHPNLRYMRRGSYWNNDIDCYSEQSTNLVDANSIILNASGIISRKPMSKLILSVPFDMGQVKSFSTDVLAEMRCRYLGLAGTYVITDVVHIIDIAAQEYTQNLTISRQYVPIAVVPPTEVVSTQLTPGS